MPDLSDYVGGIILVASFAIGGLALYLLRGNARPSAVVSAFLQVTLIPERRRQFLFFVAITVVCFLVTGVLFGLYELGARIPTDSDLPLAGAFLAGMFSLGGLAWVGLSPRILTQSERAAAEADAPKIVESLWMIPYERKEEAPAPARRP